MAKRVIKRHLELMLELTPKVLESFTPDEIAKLKRLRAENRKSLLIFLHDDPQLAGKVKKLTPERWAALVDHLDTID